MSPEAKLPEPVCRRRHRNRQAEGKTGDGRLAVPAEVARDRQVSRIADLALSQCDTGRAWTKQRGLSSPKSTPCQSGLLRQLIDRAPGPRARSPGRGPPPRWTPGPVSRRGRDLGRGLRRATELAVMADHLAELDGLPPAAPTDPDAVATRAALLP